jgi:hypothetical protein
MVTKWANEAKPPMMMPGGEAGCQHKFPSTFLFSSVFFRLFRRLALESASTLPRAGASSIISLHQGSRLAGGGQTIVYNTVQ